MSSISISTFNDVILILKHISLEGPGLIGEFFEGTEYTVKVIELGEGETLPATYVDIEALITLGGPMNVYEEEKFPFLKDETEFLKGATKRAIPVLGVCLGAQILAKALGARVRKARAPEVGWCSMRLTKDGMDDPLFQGVKAESEVFQWHEDCFDLPEDAALLSRSGICHQAFRAGPNTYGLQFHFEVTPEMVESWMNSYFDDEERNSRQPMLVEAYKREKAMKGMTHQFLLNFIRMIESNKVYRV